MDRADTIVNEALFGISEIEHEPGNYFLHIDTFRASVERAIMEERKRCADIVHQHQIAFASDACGWALDCINDGMAADAVRATKTE